MKRKHPKHYQRSNYRHIRRKKSVFQSRFFWFLALILILAIGLFYFFVFSPVFQIREVLVEGAYFANSTDIKELVEKKVERRIFFIPTKSMVVFDKNGTKKMLLDNFFAVEKAVIRKKIFHRLLVKIEEREKKAVCCALFEIVAEEATSTEEAITKEECYFLDKQGLAFQSALKEDLFQTMPVIRFENRINLKDKLIEKEYLDFVVLVNDKLKEEDILVKEFKVFPSKIEAEVVEPNLAVYFSPQKSTDSQVEDLILVLENKISSESVEGGMFTKAIEYIDLRFDKIFYK